MPDTTLWVHAQLSAGHLALALLEAWRGAGIMASCVSWVAAVEGRHRSVDERRRNETDFFVNSPFRQSEQHDRGCPGYRDAPERRRTVPHGAIVLSPQQQLNIDAVSKMVNTSTWRTASEETTMSTLTAPHGQSHHELRFTSLFNQGRALAFPCDAMGHVDLDELSSNARQNYFYARTFIGREFFLPSVQPVEE
jgi:hypothetical protein